MRIVVCMCYVFALVLFTNALYIIYSSFFVYSITFLYEIIIGSISPEFTFICTIRLASFMAGSGDMIAGTINTFCN